MEDARKILIFPHLHYDNNLIYGKIFTMEAGFDYKINILKAFAIILVVSGHLGISILPFFPTFSFHMPLFFFISGYLFKEKYLSSILEYIKQKAKRLLIPYFGYYVAYLIIIFILYKITGVFYGKPMINIKNYILSPLIEYPPIWFLGPLWFIPELFISLSVFVLFYKILKKIWYNNIFHLLIFLSLAILGIQLSFLKHNLFLLIVIKTFFSLFFIYLGFYYKNYLEAKNTIFTYKSIGLLILIQSILWLFNFDSKTHLGMTTRLYYVLESGMFYDQIFPILTSITGIWVSLFLVNIFYPYLKDSKLINNIGENTYHIMANHAILIYFLSNLFIYINKLPSSVRDNQLYWVYAPEKTVYIYLILTVIISTFIGMGINYLSKKYVNKS